MESFKLSRNFSLVLFFMGMGHRWTHTYEICMCKHACTCKITGVMKFVHLKFFSVRSDTETGEQDGRKPYNQRVELPYTQ